VHGDPPNRLPPGARVADTPELRAAQLAQAARAAARGDREAFAVIVTLTQPAILRLATRVSGNPEEGRELTQEVYLALWKILPRLDLERPLMPYLYRATVNKAARMIRRRPPVIAMDNPPDRAGADPRELMLGHQLRRALAKLSRKERLVMALTALDGKTPGEIAELTGNSPATIRVLLLRGRKKMAEFIKGPARG